MARKMLGWEDLPQFEDKVLYHIVDIAGDKPMPEWKGINEADVVARLAEELSVPADFARSEDYVRSEAHDMLWASLETLKREGLTGHERHFGANNEVRPTRDGRRRVQEWRDEWARNRQVLEKRIGYRILQDLNAKRLDNPRTYPKNSRVDVAHLCDDLDISEKEYLAAAQRLVHQGLIAKIPVDHADIADGWAYITEAGITALEAATAAARPQQDAQVAWNEVARLKRELQLAQRNLPSLVRDSELRSRCSDLLAAQGQYDRVIREACVILEDRVRRASQLSKTLVGTALMQSAFGPNGGPLQLSTHQQEQVGHMNIYSGVMSAYRNAAGHNVIDTYTHEDALRFVAMVDLLLEMVSRAGPQGPGT